MIKSVTGIHNFIVLYFKKAGQFCCLLFLFSCQHSVNTSMIDKAVNGEKERVIRSLICIDSALHLIKDGDVITRTGMDYTSQALKQFCKKDDTYSHCGIILKENDSFFVYHAIGGEINPKQTLQREWLPWFCDGTSNEGIGIFRFNLNSVKLKREKKFIAEKYAAGILFDMDFNLKSDDKMYCSEFVAKTLMYAYQNNHLFDTTHIQQLDYFAVDNIYLNKNCREIHRFKYSSN
ncbi:MAG: YiiX/YebB-like N1pC/P60 family cysteine hydrolase [Chitinophagaceae bacterium]